MINYVIKQPISSRTRSYFIQSASLQSFSQSNLNCDENAPADSMLLNENISAALNLRICLHLHNYAIKVKKKEKVAWRLFRRSALCGLKIKCEASSMKKTNNIYPINNQLVFLFGLAKIFTDCNAIEIVFFFAMIQCLPFRVRRSINLFTTFPKQFQTRIFPRISEQWTSNLIQIRFVCRWKEFFSVYIARRWNLFAKVKWFQ